MAYYNYYGFADYVSVGSRRLQAARELAKLEKKGRKTSPVVIEGRKIAGTFWGESWCDNLERYSDFANRLPRGRSYVRNGSVVDLQIAPGRVTALVSGSALYTVNVSVEPVLIARWRAICADCSGAIDSVVELLQGRLSTGVMTRLCEQKTGLFPSPKDVIFTCSCPDSAWMCKHVAAVLYGIGARLDHQPGLLFTLRQVDQQDLIVNAGADLSKKRDSRTGAKVLTNDDLAGVFGIEMAPIAARPPAAVPKTPRKSRASTASTRPVTSAKAKKAPDRAKAAAPNKRKKPKSKGHAEVRTPSKRRTLSEAMRRAWARRRAQLKKEKAPR